MSRLISRQKFIPNGFRYWEPQIKYEAPKNASFDTIVQSLITARKANPHLAKKFGWATDYENVANEVDEYNARICEQFGWNEYITGGSGGAAQVPFTQPRSSLSQLAAGAKTLVEWLNSGAEAVEAALANERAKTCAGCPLNAAGDWTTRFTKPVSEAIRKTLAKRKGMGLSTPHDAKLGVCEACHCPLALKVHLPIESILKRLPEESKAALDPRCWILSEEKTTA